MDFTSASHGASATGMETYKQDLRTNVFEKLRNALNDINDISSGNFKKVATRKVKNKLKRKANKTVNNMFK